MSTTDILFDESDLDEPDYYCEHGTFIGNPYGGDYLCHWCESGTPLSEYQAIMTVRENRRIRNRICQTYITTSVRAVDFDRDVPMDILRTFGAIVRCLHATT